jgi:hypothetical protein
LLALGICLLAIALPARAAAAPQRGDFLQTDSLSMQLVNRDFTSETTSSIADVVNLSGIAGLHCFVTDRVRLGMGIQYTRRLWPKPMPGASRFQRFALMPQVGWRFYDPFYTALIFSYAPRTLGRAIPDLAISGALGAALPMTKRVSFTLAVEVPYAFHYHRSLGLVALSGVSFRL